MLMGLRMNDLALTFPPPLLARLRSDTRVQHDAVEQTLQMMDDDLSLATYRHRIENFYGFYEPVEDQLFAADNPLETWLPMQARRKTALLKADLEALGQQVDRPLPVCVKFPQLESAADYFGCLYVLEGASLGGVVISRHVQARLGITAKSGGKFFHGYGERTGAMWQEFRAAITQFSFASDQHDAVVAAARATFETLNTWCKAKRTP